MPVTIRFALQPGTADEVVAEALYPEASIAQAMTVFRGFGRTVGLEDTATDQEVIDHVADEMFRLLWQYGERAEREHRARQLPEVAPELAPRPPKPPKPPKP